MFLERIAALISSRGITRNKLLRDHRTDRKEKPAPTDRDGHSETAKRFMGLVDQLMPDQQSLLLAQLQAWTEQNRQRSPAVPQSEGETAPVSDL